MQYPLSFSFLSFSPHRKWVWVVLHTRLLCRLDPHLLFRLLRWFCVQLRQQLLQCKGYKHIPFRGGGLFSYLVCHPMAFVQIRLNSALFPAVACRSADDPFVVTSRHGLPLHLVLWCCVVWQYPGNPVWGVLGYLAEVFCRNGTYPDRHVAAVHVVRDHVAHLDLVVACPALLRKHLVRCGDAAGLLPDTQVQSFVLEEQPAAELGVLWCGVVW